MRILLPLGLAATFAFVACSENPVEPTRAPLNPRLSQSVSGQLTLGQRTIFRTCGRRRQICPARHPVLGWAPDSESAARRDLLLADDHLPEWPEAREGRQRR